MNTASNPSQKKSDCYIMIVDDEKDFRNSMAFWFKSQGYCVEAVESGGEALELLKQKAPSIIFLDVYMPGMDGLETLQNIKKINVHIPVVLMTAFASEERRIDAYKLEANAFLDKSLDFYKAEHLINSLVRVVSKKERT